MRIRSSIFAALLLSSAAVTWPWLAAAQLQNSTENAVQAAEPFSGRVLATGLDYPWEVTWGPDNQLWVTERAGRRVTRVDSRTGEKRVAVTINEVLVGPQHEGLLGMALHPELLRGTGNDFVYVVYTYDAGSQRQETRQVERRAKLVRFTYDRNSQTLGQPTELISGIPEGTDHNAGRLKFGPDGMLYYSAGEQGANQFANYCNPIHAQTLPTAEQVRARNWASYRGKILRLAPDGGIPSDNPVINGVRSHIFTYGHRNPQGLVFGPDGTLYSAEHGPNTDDEVNIIEAGKNYGWPHVAGYRDNQAYVYSNWSAAPDCQTLTWSNITAPPSVPTQREADWNHPDFREPIISVYVVPNNQNFEDPACAPLYFICRFSIAPSSIDFYPRDGGIPGWGNSLLATSLKNGSLYRFNLMDDGRSVRDFHQLLDTVNRYRDLAISPDHMTIYIATDNGGYARDTSGGATDQLSNPGAILEFRYTGPPRTSATRPASVTTP
jgi:PQQ-dependent dehydrogenase (s-GDH family)